MNYVVGPDWRDQWDVVITSAGKPAFYTEDNRPFREVDIGTGKLKFRQVSASFISTTAWSVFLSSATCKWSQNKTLLVLCLDFLGPPARKGACVYCRMPEGAYTVYQLVTPPLFLIWSKWYSLWWHLFASNFTHCHVCRWLSLCRWVFPEFRLCKILFYSRKYTMTQLYLLNFTWQRFGRCKAWIWLDNCSSDTRSRLGDWITTKDRIQNCGQSDWNAFELTTIISATAWYWASDKGGFGSDGQNGEAHFELERWTNKTVG